jgi:hypothetical protein
VVYAIYLGAVLKKICRGYIKGEAKTPGLEMNRGPIAIPLAQETFSGVMTNRIEAPQRSKHGLVI